jgi:hypothetical protein
MRKKFLPLLIGFILVMPFMEPAVAAKQIAFTWSTSFSLAYAPGSGLKPGVNQPKSVLNSWAAEDCAKRYGFLYAEVLGASGRSLGKSNLKATKKSSSSVKAGWRKDEYGEFEFFTETKCSGSMTIPVGGPSNSYSIKAYYQVWNDSNNFKTKSYVANTESRSYSTEELDINKWRVELIAGQTMSMRCCTDDTWGPAPKLDKLPDLDFKLIETRDFNEEDQYEYGKEGKAFVFEIKNYKEISEKYKDFYFELAPGGNYHGARSEEVYANFNVESKHLTIYIQKVTKNGPGSILKARMGYTAIGFVRWVYSLENVYVYNVEKPSLVLKSKIESIRDYDLN